MIHHSPKSTTRGQRSEASWKSVCHRSPEIDWASNADRTINCLRSWGMLNRCPRQEQREDRKFMLAAFHERMPTECPVEHWLLRSLTNINYHSGEEFGLWTKEVFCVGFVFNLEMEYGCWRDSKCQLSTVIAFNSTSNFFSQVSFKAPCCCLFVSVLKFALRDQYFRV